MDWAQIFVIFLSLLLVIFIVAAVILAISLFRVTRQLKAAAVRAEQTFEESANSFRHSAVPMMAMKGIIGQAKKRARKEDKQSGDDL